MDSAVLVSMPQAWGVNASHAALSHAYVDSRASSTASSRQQEGSTRHSTDTSLVDASRAAVGVAALHDNDRLASRPTTVLSSSSSSSSSNSAFTDLSVPWAATADDVEAALPGSQLLFEPLDVSNSRRASYRDQHQHSGSMQAAPALPRYAASYHRTAVPIPAAPALINRSRSTGSSSSGSSSPTRFQRLQRHSSSAGGFLSATANQLLGALSGISLISSSTAGSSSSSSSGRRTHRVRPSPFGVRGAIRGSILVRAPALLDLDSTDSYDDLLALDQFNVKRAVKPATLAALPNRGPTAQDLQQQRQCFICLESWQQQQGQKCSSEGFDVEPEVDQDSCRCCGGCQHSGDAALDWPQQQQQDGECLVQTQRQQGITDHSQQVCSAYNAADATCRSCISGNSSSFRQTIKASVDQPISTNSSTPFTKLQQQQHQQCDIVIQQLPCGHEFCSGCICTWLKDHATCPVCRWAFADEDTQLINMGK